MAKRKKNKGPRASRSDSPSGPDGQPRIDVAPSARRPADPARRAAPRAPLGNRATPRLWLIGAGAVAVSVIGYAALRDEDPVHVERAGYAAQEDCIADWDDARDCVPIDPDAGGQASDALTPASDALAPAAGDSSGGGAASGYVGHGGARWFGPFYTVDGTVYHADGRRTHRPFGATRSIPVTEWSGQGVKQRMGLGPARALMVEEARVRPSRLGSGQTAGMSMRSLASAEHRATSRGGFLSSRGFSGGG